jgi:molybdopterin-guanine dinucleotide biosynthesis protein A
MTDGRAGVVVAGGRSTRMGDRDKTVVDVAGVPMVRRVADRLLEATDELVVNCRADQREAIADALEGLSPTFAVDEEPDRGPVAGVARGLRAAETPRAAVVAADVPLLDPDLLRYLFERAADHDAAVPRPGDWFEPLHAVYRPEPMADACEAALEGGDPRLVEPVFTLDTVVVERQDLVGHGSLESFESVDTPDDLRWVVDRLE